MPAHSKFSSALAIRGWTHGLSSDEIIRVYEIEVKPWLRINHHKYGYIFFDGDVFENGSFTMVLKMVLLDFPMLQCVSFKMPGNGLKRLHASIEKFKLAKQVQVVVINENFGEGLTNLEWYTKLALTGQRYMKMVGVMTVDMLILGQGKVTTNELQQLQANDHGEFPLVGTLYKPSLIRQYYPWGTKTFTSGNYIDFENCVLPLQTIEVQKIAHLTLQMNTSVLRHLMDNCDNPALKKQKT